MAEAAQTQTLPQVFLRNLQIPLQVLSLVPITTVEKFQVAAFEVNESTLKLAIVYPEQLKQGFYTALSDIGKKIGRTVELFRTDHASMQALIEQYHRQLSDPAPIAAVKAVEPPKPPKPVVIIPPPLFELGKTVAYNYLKRIPVEFGRQHRLICVDYLPPNEYWVVTDRAELPATEEIIKGIEKYNNLVTHLVPVKPEQFDDLLKYYITQQENEQKRLKEQKEQALAAIPLINSKLDVVVPMTQAIILSQEDALPGVAGFFQRVTQSINVKHEDSDEEPLLSLPAKSIPEPLAATPIPTTALLSQPLPAPTAPPTTQAPALQPAPTAAPAQPPGDEGGGDIGKLLDKPIETLDQLKEVVRNGSIPRIVASVINFAIHEKASDIHLESFRSEVVVRYRVDGQLMEIVKMPSDIHAAIVSRIKILAKLRLDETRVPQDGRFDVNFQHAQVDLRVSILPTVHGEKVVMRILDKNRGITSLESLGIQGLAYDNIIKSIAVPFGICLSTGPTGSGKSTSLYAILKQIATPNVNVSTLEDPVEYEMNGINQSQIRPKIGFTFAEGLRALLRQDPNIIMVGEIRDGETANMATQAALTGHLVLSTLHTNDAAGAIPRLENMGIEPFLITSSLTMVMGQRLARKICQNCKREIDLPEGLKDKFKEDVEKISKLNSKDALRVSDPLKFYQGAGCDQCRGKGYQGRIGIYEVLVMSETIEELTLKREPASQIQQQAQREGMLTMYQDGLLKVLAGLTTLDEVLRETTNK